MIYLCTACEFETATPTATCPECRSLTVAIADLPTDTGQASQRVPLGQIVTHTPRVATGLPWLDRVLYGGMVPGTVALLAGEPGIGKTTLLVQLAGAFATSCQAEVLFASSEEAEPLFRERAERLGIVTPHVYFLETANVVEILQEAADVDLLVVDSMQTILSPELDAPAGGVKQVCECTGLLVRWARERGVPVWALCQVTKDGHAAGPMAIRHMVDAVHYLVPGKAGEPEGVRSLVTDKDRWAPGHPAVSLVLTESGLKEASHAGQQAQGGVDAVVPIPPLPFPLYPVF